MMAYNLPRIYKDESYHSIISRTYLYSFELGINSFKEKLFGKRISNNPNTAVGIKEFSEYFDNFYCTIDNIIDKHSLYNFYRIFIDETEQKELYDIMVGKKASKKAFLTNYMGRKAIGYCPKCIKEQIEVYGEAYQIRFHQILPYKICSKHKVLIKSKSIEDDYRFFTVGLNFDLEEKVLDKVVEEKLLQISKLIEKLILSPIIESALMALNVMFLGLDKLSYLSYSKKINKKVLSDDLNNYFGEEIIKIYNEKDISSKNLKFISDYKSYSHIKSLNMNLTILILTYLDNFLGIEELVQEIKTLPLNVYECKNPICENYKKRNVSVSKEVTDAHNNSRKIVVCDECGFSYSFLGEYPISIRILNRGYLWNERFKEMIYDDKYTLNEICSELEVSTTTAIKIIKEKYHDKNLRWNIYSYDKKVLKNFDYLKDKHINTILKYINYNPYSGRERIKKDCPGAYEWVRINCREWFEDNIPKLNKKGR